MKTPFRIVVVEEEEAMLGNLGLYSHFEIGYAIGQLGIVRKWRLSSSCVKLKMVLSSILSFISLVD